MDNNRTSVQYIGQSADFFADYAALQRRCEYYNKMLLSDGVDTWENIDCDVQRLLQEIREIAEDVKE